MHEMVGNSADDIVKVEYGIALNEAPDDLPRTCISKHIAVLGGNVEQFFYLFHVH